jgi:hypothetical protein
VKALQLILIFVGMIRIAGYIFGSPSAEQLGFVIGASPLPLAFSHRSGWEDFVLDAHYEWHENGSQKDFLLSEEQINSLPGFWINRGVWTVGTLYAPRFDTRVTDQTLRHLGCKYFTHGNDFTITITSKVDSTYRWKRNYECSL